MGGASQRKLFYFTEYHEVEPVPTSCRIFTLFVHIRNICSSSCIRPFFSQVVFMVSFHTRIYGFENPSWKLWCARYIRHNFKHLFTLFSSDIFNVCTRLMRNFGGIRWIFPVIQKAFRKHFFKEWNRKILTKFWKNYRKFSGKWEWVSKNRGKSYLFLKILWNIYRNPPQ